MPFQHKNADSDDSEEDEDDDDEDEEEEDDEDPAMKEQIKAALGNAAADSDAEVKLLFGVFHLFLKLMMIFMLMICRTVGEEYLYVIPPSHHQTDSNPTPN